MTVAAQPPEAAMADTRVVMPVECLVRDESCVPLETLRQDVEQYLGSLSKVMYEEGPIPLDPSAPSSLTQHVESLVVTDLTDSPDLLGRPLLPWDVAWQVMMRMPWTSAPCLHLDEGTWPQFPGEIDCSLPAPPGVLLHPGQGRRRQRRRGGGRLHKSHGVGASKPGVHVSVVE